MYAVIKTGGKQYRIAENDVIEIEKLPGDTGDTVSFEQVLMAGSGEDVTIGTPFIDGAKVEGEILDQKRARKIIVFKKKRRHNYRRKKGHRQHLTRVKITNIAV